ncbi:MAG: Riboflavin biosynthesis protein RibF [Syntrophaceae bacterium PtaU1.Bin231]|nr:MAG: Riboflavin biosynthesis protein RibF [Syntrophaceae bacterium PtaU1.Bin231]HOG15698.1 bifunctional riboflavin kinase/FAD synthetase [Syntrophales bacterium]HOI18024.1 bifunctional riboflavin kinase/FAD synthetase [Geobacteraceae bacterium]
MKVLRGLDEISPEYQENLVTIGNFDGVHLGHQALFRQLLREARSAGRLAVVLTFEPHPKMVLHPERRPFYLITTLEEKIRLIGACGIDGLLILPFSAEFARTSAEQFVQDILWDRLRISKILIGHDYSFGRSKEGNNAYLTDMGQKLGFAVETIGPVKVGDMIISSTRARHAILAGDMKTTRMILGRPYNLSGLVVPGKRRGLGLGFPTANIRPDKALIPPRGVYAVLAELDGKILPGVLSIGINPTFAGDTFSIEVHILDFRANLYGRNLNVLFIERIRDEMKFDSPQQLVEHIKLDIERSVPILNSYLQSPH